MRAWQVTKLEGPAALELVDVPQPTPGPGQVLVEVHRAGISFPDLLLTKGMYQLKPELPFISGSDWSGVVVGGEGVAVGTRVCGVGSVGASGEYLTAYAASVLPIPDSITFDQAAALPMNYLTAHFVLTQRAHAKPGESVLITGAAGGVGTATIQVAKGLGLSSIALVSTPEKAEIAKQAGADHTVLLDGFKDTVKEITGGKGANIVVDVVGGEIFTDLLRSTAAEGRVMIVGFASGQGIPEVKVNRLLLNNTEVRGAAWGEFVSHNPAYIRQQWAELVPMMDSGVIDPPIGTLYEHSDYPQSIIDMDDRKTLGKSVVKVRD